MRKADRKEKELQAREARVDGLMLRILYATLFVLAAVVALLLGFFFAIYTGGDGERIL